MPSIYHRHVITTVMNRHGRIPILFNQQQCAQYSIRTTRNNVSDDFNNRFELKPQKGLQYVNMEIENRHTILSEIDAKLGRNKPPAIEYLYVEPYTSFQWLGRNLAQNPYGHAAIRYTLPPDMMDGGISDIDAKKGRQTVMNIVGNRTMVNFLTPDEYLFGNPSQYYMSGAEQGGIYNRSFIGFRIEEYPPELILQMHEFYQSIHEKESQGLVKFSLFFAPIMNYISQKAAFLISDLSERGNCSHWTSSGMARAGLFKTSTMWPKYIFVKLYMRALLGMRIPANIFFDIIPSDVLSILEMKDGKSSAHATKERIMNNVNIVSYRRYIPAVEEFTRKNEPVGWIKPFRTLLENELFFDLDRYSNVIVGVEERTGTEEPRFRGTVETRPPVFRPFWPKEP